MEHQRKRILSSVQDSFSQSKNKEDGEWRTRKDQYSMINEGELWRKCRGVDEQEGVINYANGDVYEGDWGNRNGNGIMKYANANKCL